VIKGKKRNNLWRDRVLDMKFDNPSTLEGKECSWRTKNWKERRIRKYVLRYDPFFLIWGVQMGVKIWSENLCPLNSNNNNKKNKNKKEQITSLYRRASLRHLGSTSHLCACKQLRLQAIKCWGVSSSPHPQTNRKEGISCSYVRLLHQWMLKFVISEIAV
jgi:hypothetical protein